MELVIPLSRLFEFGILLFFLFLSLIYLVMFKYKPKTISIKQKHVIISGASSGIGKSMALKLARLGCRLDLIARNETRLEETRLKCVAEAEAHGFSGHQIETHSIDLANESIESIKSAFGQNPDIIDAVVCCAGSSVPDNLENLSENEIRGMIGCNFVATIKLTRALLPIMLDQPKSDRRIMFVSSQAGQIGLYGYSVYGATKFGLRGFAESLRLECFKHKIFISIAYPPDTDTPGFREDLERAPDVSKILTGVSGLWSSEDVAGGMVESLESGALQCTFGLNGWILGVVSNGANPGYNPLMVLLEALVYPILRIIVLLHSIRFYKICDQYEQQQPNQPKKQK